MPDEHRLPDEAIRTLNEADALIVAPLLGLRAAPSRESRKLACIGCESSDALHAYEQTTEGRAGFFCFNCERSWSNIDAAMHVRGLGFVETVRWLAPQLGVPLPPERANGTDPERGQARLLAAVEAQRLLAESFDPNPQHGYLREKGVAPHDLRQEGSDLIISMHEELGGPPVNVQRIKPDGRKRFLFRGQVSGCFRVLGSIEGAEKVVIGEGFATAASVAEATGLPAVIAFFAGNLPAVARKVRRWLPDAEIVIAGDKDPAGRMKAEAAARAVNGLVALPAFAEGQSGSDWNDYSVMHGPDAVRGALAAATTAPEPGPSAEPAPTGGGGRGVTVEDLYAYMPMHSYIFAPTREMWPATSVNARVEPIPVPGEPDPLRANVWLDRFQAVEQLTWAPGMPMLIENRLISGGGWIERPGCRVFNSYRPPTVLTGDPREADRWVRHVGELYPADADHIIRWLAQRVQRPHEKINHAIVLGGPQGIGKDTILEPVKHAVGPWNFEEPSPSQMLGRFNGFVKSVILRISEARDLGDIDRYAFYEHMKVYTAAPPDVLRCDEKHLREHYVPNVTGVIITTNYKIGGIYLPPDDRRHFVAWSDRRKEEFGDGYFTGLYRWYEDGGFGHVAALLATLDISGFDAKAPPPRTDAFREIVDSNRAPEDAELTDILDTLGYPPSLTLAQIADAAGIGAFRDWLLDRRNGKTVNFRLADVGYERVRNDAQEDGRWRVGGRNVSIYASRERPIRDRIAAARALAGGW